jgi:hypothetical protein
MKEIIRQDAEMDYDSGFTDNVGMLRSSHAEIRMFSGRILHYGLY